MKSTPGLGIGEPQASQYLGRLLETLPLGVVTVDGLGFVRGSNRAAAAILTEVDETLTGAIYECFEDAERLRVLVEDCLEKDVELPPENFERVIGGERQIIAVTVRSVDIEADEPAVMLLLEDVTGRTIADSEMRRAVLDREFLAQVGTVLAASLDYRATLANLARLIVDYLADWCGINLIEEDGSITRAAVAHSDRSKEPLVIELQDRHSHDPNATTGVPQVLRTGEALLIPDVTDELLVETAHNEDYLRIVRELGFSSCIIVPIETHGQVIGAITLVSNQPTRKYDTSHLEIARDLAQRAGLAIRNSLLFSRVEESRRRSAAIARTLQASLLPPELPNIPKMEVAELYQPGGEGLEVGGDFYDVFDLGTGHWGVVIGDVQGHGAEAATVTSLARYSLRAESLRLERPTHVLYQVNKAILNHTSGERFLSACYLRLKPGPQVKMVVACAGHPRPLLLRAGGSVEAVGGRGMLLGLFPAPELSERGVVLEPGDALLLYTDGVTEAGAPIKMLGERGLKQLLARCKGMTAEEIISSLEEELSVWGAEQGPRDDCAALVLRLTP